MIEVIHNAGYIHNDICFEKIDLGYDQKLVFKGTKCINENIFDDLTLHFSDFSYFTPYIDLETQSHLKQEKTCCTSFDIANEFQTLNRLNLQRTSRKDDLEMLCNFLIFLKNYFQQPELVFPSSTYKNQESRLYFLQAYKKQYTLNRLCDYLNKCEQYGLLTFCLEVQQLKYTEKPNYERLRSILHGLFIGEKQKLFHIMIKQEKEQDRITKQK